MDTINYDNARINRSKRSKNEKARARYFANGYYIVTKNGYYIKDGVAPVDKCRECELRDFRHNCGHSRTRYFIGNVVVSCRPLDFSDGRQGLPSHQKEVRSTNVDTETLSILPTFRAEMF